MRYLSVCSGIEAASVAWEPLGWQPAAFSEIDRFARAVLHHRYPAVPCHGDFTTIEADEYGSVDLLVGGTPCQSFSLAGLRGGLADDRGVLALEFLRLAHRSRTRWLVWENVPGVLSIDKGRAFGSILGGLGQLGYGWAYRVLDAQYFGIPQRRRRVILVACLGDWRAPAAVLLERASMSGAAPPSRGAREDVAGSGLLGAVDGEFNALDELSGPLTTGLAKGNRGTVLAFDTTQITHPENRSNPQLGDPCPPLAAQGHPPALAIPILEVHGRRSPANAASPKAGSGFGEDGDPMFTLQSKHQHAIAFQPRIVRNGRGYSEGVMPALNGASAGATSDMRPVVAMPDPAGGIIVRRITPREGERLQGFPDDWTLVPYRGRPAGDTPRYQALGNTMAVPVMRWIGERIQMVEALRGQ